MANETTIDTKAAIEAPAKVVEAIADSVKAVSDESVKAAKRARATNARRAKRQAAALKTAGPKTATRRATRKTRTSTRKIKTAARKTAAVAQKRIETVTKNVFSGFDAVPAFAPFQSMFSNVNDRGQDFVKRGQKVAEELADLARSNVEAVVEAGRVTAEGTRSLGQEVATTGRSGYEQAADAIRSLAEAKSPTEYLQLQSEFARASFDRMVAQSSRLTESMVKLAGEAFQPLSNRASANAERFNTLVA